MSKKKDRLNTHFRNCPICGGKQIYVYKRKKVMHEKAYIHCYKCNRNVQVKDIYNKRNRDSFIIEQVFKGRRGV